MYSVIIILLYVDLSVTNGKKIVSLLSFSKHSSKT
jgi:hypothetical protein